MEIRKNKPIIPIALTLILTLTSFTACLQFASAVDNPPAYYPTYSFLSVNPNPIGVNQPLSVNFWLDKVTPNAATLYGDRWSQVSVIITKPDGKTETKGPFTFDAVGSGYTVYTPTTVGEYTFQMKFPGQWINYTSGANTFKNYYQPSESTVVTLNVQAEAIPYWTDIPLPTGYWTRPLNAELRGENAIASYWLAGGSTGPHGPRAYGSLGNFQPYGAAPNSAHVLWTRAVAFGGAVGGEYGSFGDEVYYPGETYERKFQPPIIMNGRLYYNQRLSAATGASGSALFSGCYCVDLYTGETIWYLNGTVMTFGQLLNMQTPNQHGVIPYLWSVVGTTYKMYDAFTGDWLLDIASVPSGSMVFGDSGEFLIYSLSAASNRMTLWNSTKAIQPNIDTFWSWRPTSTAGAASSVNVTAGYQWNVSIPDVPGSQSIAKITSDVIYARATHVSSPAAVVTDVAYDIRGGKPAQQLWQTNRTFEGTIMTGPMNNPRIDSYYNPQESSTYNPLPDCVFTTFVKETMVWYGYSVQTGAQIWGPTDPYSSAWGVYQPYADTSLGFGKFYAGGYDGTVHCFDFKTGENLWNYNTGSSGFETPYGTYPFKDNALTVADGKVFAATNEHSPNTPYFHGWRLHAIDVETGQAVWNVSYIGLAPIIADGYALALNYFDNRIYCFGIGPSATTVNASPKVTAKGGSLLIEGTVTDQSPGAKGAPAVADESMSAWMEYLYEQRVIPANAKGVNVTLTAIDPNGNPEFIGIVTADMSGMFKKLWTPQLEGEYTVIASFGGSASYGSSYAETAIAITAASAASPTEAATPTPTAAPTATPTVAPTASPSPYIGPDAPNNTAFYIGIAAVVIIIAIAAIAYILRRRK